MVVSVLKKLIKASCYLVTSPNTTYMKMTQKKTALSLKDRVIKYIDKLKNIKGDPHYIALGMAIGVFVSLTPIIPFHTVIALAMAIALRGSKAAAAFSVWFSNPITIPFFYIWSYKTGTFLLGKYSSDLSQIVTFYKTMESSLPFSVKVDAIMFFLGHHLMVAVAMLIGGALIGIFPGIATYFITRKAYTILCHKRKARSQRKAQKL